MKIREITESERPRERLERYGAASLGSGELLAVLLRTGTKDESALELAQKLLSAAGGSLLALSRMSLAQMRSIKGLGGAKALPVMAALELGRRFMEEKMNLNRTTIVSPSQIYSLMSPRLKGLQTEECWVVFLNSASYVLSTRKMSSGGLNATIIDVRSIVAAALDEKACSLVLVHNHPSGNPRPGSQDLKQTAVLRDALTPFGIAMIDHVVVCDDCCYSFADDKVYLP